MSPVRASRSIALLWLLSLPAVAGAADPTLGLADAARQALDANLDLAAQRRALAANREEIDIARSALLPRIDLGARAQRLESDRSNDSLGNITEKTVGVGAELTQVLYDETDWADFQIQKHVYTGQTQQFEAFQLGVVQAAANTFLELDRSHAVVSIQERNRELTARNLETSRARIAAGWSSQREMLRWESQLASNDTDVVAARTEVLVNRFEMNRIRNQPVEAPIEPLVAGVEEYGFVYARTPIAEAIATPEGDRRLRDLLVRVGLARSPELAAIDAAIAAEERLLTSNERAFWVPSLSVDAGVDYLDASGSGAPGLDFDETEWTIGAGLTFPLFEGGAKFAALRQSREFLSGLRIQRRATAQSIDQSIRSAFAEASGSYTNIGFARKQEAAARKNFDLVNDSYVLGVASILDLLDAQAQLLDADLAVANALYKFLEDLIAAERQIAFYPFLESEFEVAELLSRMEQALRLQP
jgi:outer membrane protein TolC